jgi:beta-lactamase regulating signal transducer with metallopeptidase domain
MIVYILKSTISMLVLYGFYHLLLRQHKILIFNRIYLISSLLFSLIIPLIVIPVKTGFSINTTISSITATTNQVIQSKGTMVTSAPHITYETVIVIFFLLISALLLLRFGLNIFNLIIKIRKGGKIEKKETTLVLVDENIIPYSFFRYIFINRKTFEDGKIERELLLHEEAHCLQYHSIDIIILEIINIFLWFNPAIWLFRKAIQLNHEYYADNRVLTNSDSEDYHQLLINLVIQNNTSYLVSNFKYSLIKNRLIMMTKNNPSGNAVFRKIVAISIFLIMTITLTFSQENKITTNVINYENEWWYPILQKHKVDIKQFNFINTFNTGSSDSIRSIAFEIGNCDSTHKSILTLKDPFFILRESEDAYSFITAKLAIHDLENSQIKWKVGKIEEFGYKTDDFEPSKNYSFDELNIDLKTNKVIIKNISAVINLNNNRNR